MNGVEKKALINSLNRIEGHARGIKKMVNAERCIADILLQLSAVRAGVVRTQVQTLRHCCRDKGRSLEELKELFRLAVQPTPARKKR